MALTHIGRHRRASRNSVRTLLAHRTHSRRHKPFGVRVRDIRRATPSGILTTLAVQAAAAAGVADLVTQVVVGVLQATVVLAGPAADRRHPRSPFASIRRATCCGSATTSHSQTRMTPQPREIARAVDLRSRSRFRAIFSSHKSALGPAKGALRPCRGHECQKHPSTNTASRRRGIKRSGVHPLASRT